MSSSLIAIVRVNLASSDSKISQCCVQAAFSSMKGMPTDGCIMLLCLLCFSLFAAGQGYC
jgi:hypothetical protein